VHRLRLCSAFITRAFFRSRLVMVLPAGCFSPAPPERTESDRNASWGEKYVRASGSPTNYESIGNGESKALPAVAT
jgi:hypothetical protein